MSRVADLEALAVQNYVAENHDMLIFAVASQKFPIPPPVREYGNINAEFTIDKTKVLTIIRGDIEKYDFDAKAFQKIAAMNPPTQAGEGSIITNIVVDFLDYYKEILVMNAKILHDEALEKLIYSTIKELEKKDLERFTASLGKYSESFQSLKTFREMDAGNAKKVFESLKELVYQEGNEKTRNTFEKKARDIDESRDKKMGTMMQKGEIQKDIDGKASAMSITVLKKLYNEAKKYEVLTKPEKVRPAT
jgi:hypothetical protein